MKWRRMNQFIETDDQPSSRWGHSGCNLFDPYIALFGGYSECKYYNDTWLFNWQTFKWTLLKSTILPEPRSNSTLIFDTSQKRIVMFGGGASSNKRFNDLWQLPLNLTSNQQIMWRNITPVEMNNLAEYPWQRTYHVGSIMMNNLIIHGGQGYGNDLDDLWVFDLNKLTWRQVKTQNTPKGRRFHSSVVIGSQFYIIGGCYAGYICMNDIHSINLSQFIKDADNNNSFNMPEIKTCSWKNILLSDNSIFIPRWGHNSCQLNGDIYVFGGRSVNDHNQILLISTSDQKKQNQSVNIIQLASHNTPKGRRKGCLWIVGSCIIIHGGFNGIYLEDMNFVNLHGTNTINFLHSNIVQKEEMLLDTDQCDIHIYTEDKKKLHLRTSEIRHAFVNENSMIQFISFLGEIPYELARKYVEVVISGQISEGQSVVKIQLLNDFQVLLGYTALQAAQKRLQFNIIREQTPINTNIISAFKVTEKEIQRIFARLQADIFNDCVLFLDSKTKIKCHSRCLMKRSKYFKNLIQSFSNFSEEIIQLINGSQNIFQYKLLMIYLHYGHMVIPQEYELYQLMRCYVLAEMYAIEGARIILLNQILQNIKHNKSSGRCGIKSILMQIMQFCMKGDDVVNLDKIIDVSIGKLIVQSFKSQLKKEQLKLNNNNIFNFTQKVYKKFETLKQYSHLQENQSYFYISDKENIQMEQISEKPKTQRNNKNNQQINRKIKLQEKMNKIAEFVQNSEKKIFYKNNKDRQPQVLNEKNRFHRLTQLYKFELSYYNLFI